jgi:hypothetical protein
MLSLAAQFGEKSAQIQRKLQRIPRIFGEFSGATPQMLMALVGLLTPC